MFSFGISSPPHRVNVRLRCVHKDILNVGGSWDSVGGEGPVRLLLSEPTMCHYSSCQQAGESLARERWPQ